MATVQLGKIKQVWRGTYNNGTAYTVDDLVAYTDGTITSTYICVANSTGNAPSSGGTAHASWNYVAKGVTDPIPSQSGNAGKVLKTDGSSLSFATAFAGTHYLAYSNRHDHGNAINVNGSGLSHGQADGQRDCIVINNNLYHTVTPAHNDDLFIIKGGSTTYFHSGSSGAYGGLGIMTSTATDFSANRNVPFTTGQHAWGNGGSNLGDPYDVWEVDQMLTASEMSFTVGTTYYIRLIGQIHTSNQTMYFNNSSGAPYTRSKYWSSIQHLKKVT